MAHLIEGTCSVCGEETKQRCSACAKTGIDVFFCSTVHQGLVWPVHKLVCGPGKANPFAPPDLAAVDMAALKATLDEPTGVSVPADIFAQQYRYDATVSSFVESFSGLAKGDLKKIASDFDRSTAALSKSCRGTFTLMIRHALWLAAGFAHSSNRQFPEISEFYMCAYLELGRDEMFASPSEHTVSTYLHRALVLLAATKAVARARAATDSTAKSVVGMNGLCAAWEAWVGDLLPLMDTSSMEMLSAVLDWWIQPLVQAFPTYNFAWSFGLDITPAGTVGGVKNAYLVRSQKRH